MAIPSTREGAPSRPMGDAVRGTITGDAQVTELGFILCHICESWNTHLFHDRTSDTHLVWKNELRKKVGYKQRFGLHV